MFAVICQANQRYIVITLAQECVHAKVIVTRALLLGGQNIQVRLLYRSWLARAREVRVDLQFPSPHCTRSKVHQLSIHPLVLRSAQVCNLTTVLSACQLRLPPMAPAPRLQHISAAVILLRCGVNEECYSEPFGPS